MAEVFEVALPLRRPFVTSFGATTTRRTVLVHLVGVDGAEGWGEAAALDHPFYLPDTTSSTFAVVTEWALPAALEAGPDPGSVARALEPIRGNTFARAGVEAAFWCLEAVRSGSSLAELFAYGGGGGQAVASASRAPLRLAAPVGESIGISETIEETLDEVQLCLAEGYQRVKLKIKPGWDLELVAAVREAVGEEVMLQVDANGAYSTDESDLSRLERLDEYGLACIEQPLAWDDIMGHSDLQRRIKTPICLDECLRSPRDVHRALALGACRNVNLKPGRVGGISASLAIHDVCRAQGVPLWCGGMLESGIGRAINLALCALPGVSDPADMSPASVLYEWDLIDPTYEVDRDGTIAIPSTPGLGFEVRRDRVKSQATRHVAVSPK